MVKFPKTLINPTENEFNYEVVLAGNPNVGKSTIFNALTGLNQHTGNWCGKTVKVATGQFSQNNTTFNVVDLPGAYSLNSKSTDEIVSSEYILKNQYSCVVFVVDSTNLERNLSFVLQALPYTQKAILCLNLYDETKKMGIVIDADELSLQLGIPVVKTSSKDKSSLINLKQTIHKVIVDEIKTYKVKSIPYKNNFLQYSEYITEIFKYSSRIADLCIINNTSKDNSNAIKIDRLFVAKYTAIPIMFLLLTIIFLITVYGANYISDFLYSSFLFLGNYLYKLFELIGLHSSLQSLIIEGIYTTVTWVVSVMLPPIVIFFPLFSLLEESGILPRIAFNLDDCFKKSGTNGKQALTMAMGFGCNACGVTGCRIFDSNTVRSSAIITNSFIPCNGRLPSIIAVISIFFITCKNIFIKSIYSSLILICFLIFSIIISLLVTKILTALYYKDATSTFLLELPKIRKPEIFKTIMYSLKNKAISVLGRAILVSIFSGLVIWLLVNIKVNEITLLSYCANFLNPVALIFGLDGVILLAFILGFPANEIVIPIILMSYMSLGTLSGYSDLTQLGNILANNGWTILTAICFLVFTLFHFPCSTTCLTVYQETKSISVTLLSFFVPLTVGLMMCFIINTSAYFISLF